MKPSHCKDSCADVNNQIAEFTGALDCIRDTMKTIFQAPVPPPVDQIMQAHSHIITAIQQDMLGTFTTEERGGIINYIITNPAATTTYEQLSNDGCLLCTWLSMTLSN